MESNRQCGRAVKSKDRQSSLQSSIIWAQQPPVDQGLLILEVVYMVMLGKPEGRRPLGRPRFRWVDNIRMDLQDVRCGYMDWIGLAQDRDSWRTLVSAVMNLRVP